MKKILIYLISINFAFQTINILSITAKDKFGLIHIKILERNVPEFKEFTEKLRELFIIKDEARKEAFLNEVINFGKNIISNIDQRLAKENLTVSQRKSMNLVKVIIQTKVNQLENQ